MADATETTIAFVDLAGFTALTETHGDDEAADLAERFTELARTALGSEDRLVKSIGDAVLLTAPSPSAAAELFDIAAVPKPEGGAIDPVCRMHVERSNAAGRLRHNAADYWFCSLDCVSAFAAEPERFTVTDELA